jgi:hypothetical protein
MSSWSFSFPEMTTDLLIYLLAYPKTQAWVECLKAWCEWHVHQARCEIQALVAAWDRCNP